MQKLCLSTYINFWNTYCKVKNEIKTQNLVKNT